MKGDIVRIQNREELPKKLRMEIDERVKNRLIFLNAIANHDMAYWTTREVVMEVKQRTPLQAVGCAV